MSPRASGILLAATLGLSIAALLSACPSAEAPHDLREAWALTPATLDPAVRGASFAIWELAPASSVEALGGLSGPRQELLPPTRPDRTRVRVRVEPTDARLPLPPPAGDPNPTPADVADAPPTGRTDAPSEALAGLAARLREGVDSRRAYADAVLRWQRTNLRTGWAPEDALDPLRVLRNRRAECLGHAALAAALLRAQGIDARTVTGLALRGDVLVHHAWVEYEDGRTATLDPMWGLHPAPATHLRLLVMAHDAQGVLQASALVPFEASVRALRVEALRRALE